MKIRTGFVSNSSSSSFCLYGVYVEDIDKLLEQAQELFKKNGNSDADPQYPTYPESIRHKDTYVLEYADTGIFYLGTELLNMEEDETFREFKDRTQQAILDLDIELTGFEVHEKGWYDG
jgi:hypothetical protein